MILPLFRKREDGGEEYEEYVSLEEMAKRRERKWRGVCSKVSCLLLSGIVFLSVLRLEGRSGKGLLLLSEEKNRTEGREESNFVSPECARVAFGIGGATVFLFLLLPCFLLPCFGFGGRGVGSGSAAAAYQSTLGGTSIASGSAFSLLQSAAAGGVMGLLSLFYAGVLVTGTGALAAATFCETVHV